MSEAFENWFTGKFIREDFGSRNRNLIGDLTLARMQTAFAAGQAAEREECAKIVAGYINYTTYAEITKAIRKRGEEP